MPEASTKPALTLLRRAIDTVVNLAPKEDHELPVIEYMPIKMTWQSVSRCEGIFLLLQDGLLDEASILLRSLMWDAQRLIYLDKHPNDRIALILGLRQSQLNNWEELSKLAEECGRDAEPIRATIKLKRRQIEKARMKHGIGRLKKFPAEGIGIARNVGRLSDMIGHKMYSIAAHNSAQSMLVGEARGNDGSVKLFTRNKHPTYVKGIAGSASEYLFEGTIATAKAQEWATLQELTQEYSEIDAEFESLLKNTR